MRHLRPLTFREAIDLMRGMVVPLVLLVSLTACPPKGTEAGDRAAATAAAVSPPLVTWDSGGERSPVVLYIDRSGSMRGYLDPEYPSQVKTEYRSVIDGLVAGLQPSAFGFGTVLRPVSASLGALGDLSFYSDNNTLLEHVLDRIQLDTLFASSHVIVGDGRRSNPNSANHQYVRMRELATRWIEAGGTFMVAASMAPFRMIPNDPAGCRAPPGGVISTCALYAFVYAASGDEARIAAILAGRFEHLFVWPVPALPPGSLVMHGPPASPAIRIERAWQRANDSTPIVRSRGLSFTNLPVRAHLIQSDTLSVAGATHASILRGHTIRATVVVKPLATHAASDWAPVPATGSLVRLTGSDPLGVDLTTHGANHHRFVYRIELFPDGTPTWLERFDAGNAADRVRTYGLGRLFEQFRYVAEHGPVPPIGRVYVVAN
jgi:hypothetical protein